MNKNHVRSSYHLLQPEERFRLVLAAQGRKDESEENALHKSAAKSTFEILCHIPFLHAFEKIGLVMFIEITEDAAFFRDCLDFYYEGCETAFLKRQHEAELAGEEFDEDWDPDMSDPEGYLGLTREEQVLRASAYIFLAKYEGWAKFCEELKIPTHHPWDEFPGLKRLIQNIEIAQRWRFSEAEMLGWLQQDDPELKQVPARTEFYLNLLRQVLEKTTDHCK